MLAALLLPAQWQARFAPRPAYRLSVAGPFRARLKKAIVTDICIIIPLIMLVCRQSESIEVRRSEQRGRGGRGVFACREIAAGTLIERVPVLLIPKNQVFGDPPDGQRSARISWYVFDWEGLTKRDYVALALGYGSIYNHSFEPNAKYTPVAPDLLEFHSLRTIAAGDEILINYHGKPEDQRPVDFELI